MAEYIMTILRSQLMVMFSWGFHRPTALPNNRGLVFKVDGFKYKGMVKVIYNVGADLFEIHLDDGSIEEDVYADQLVDIIDSMVERTYNYAETVISAYKLSS